MLLTILAGLLLALGMPIWGKLLKSKASYFLGLLPLSLFLYYLAQISAVKQLGSVSQKHLWVPSLGVELSFSLDGLSLLFALMITGIGTLVFFYSAYYLKGHKYLDRFYGYLGVFMSAMLGVVLSDNVLSLFIFWELTSISSFFLIGFNNHDPASRKSALTALGITGFGGLALLAALLLTGTIHGTYSIAEMLQSGIISSEHPWYIGILILVFLAAFTKSAQFPFHFWLPGAMKAPTPVSTYLHSATMVKAGVYLLFRFTPLLGNHEYWNTTLIIVGGITMLYAAIQTLFKTDLKGILACSTISALGILVFLIGLGTPEALLAAATFILVHALYKATLFLITGIIDHEAHTRNVTELSGLRKVMPVVALAGFLAALSNAGFPPFFGFVGKDLIYESTLHHAINPWLLTALALITNVLLLWAGFVAGVKPFMGTLPTRFEKIHMPSVFLWLPPMLLASLGLFFGLIPSLLENSLAKPILAVSGFSEFEFHLKLWHGFNTVLLLSGITLALGFLLYFVLKPSSLKENFIDKAERFGPKVIITEFAAGFQWFAGIWTHFFQNGYLRFYVLTILVFLIGVLSISLFGGVNLYIDYSKLSELTFYEVSVVLIMLVSIGFTVFATSRLAAVAAMSVVGYAICLIFVFYSAPDLAMTQFTIDTLTVILFVLVLYRLPRYINFSNTITRLRDGFFATSFGILITIIVLEVLNEPTNRETSEFYAENSYVLAKGKNVVNVILVDFRGADTLVEIIVLTVAAIGVFSLLKLRLKYSDKM